MFASSHPILTDMTGLTFGTLHGDVSSYSSLNYATPPAANGLKVHIALCSSDDGLPLGILHETLWVQEKNRHSSGYQQRKAAIKGKERYRWLEHQEISQRLIPETVQVITITDREGDIYELFAQLRRPKSEFLIRAAQNRSTKTDAFAAEVIPLFEAILSSPCQGYRTLELVAHPQTGTATSSLECAFCHAVVAIAPVSSPSDQPAGACGASDLSRRDTSPRRREGHQLVTANDTAIEHLRMPVSASNYTIFAG